MNNLHIYIILVSLWAPLNTHAAGTTRGPQNTTPASDTTTAQPMAVIPQPGGPPKVGKPGQPAAPPGLAKKGVVVPPAPPVLLAPPPPNAADTWVPTKIDDQLFNKSVEEKTTVGNVMNEDGSVSTQLMISQKNSFEANSNSMYNCVETSISGRKDNLCKNDPANPECVGLNTALNKSTSCAMFAPDGVTCLSYGADGYTGEEWLSFGTQYFNGMLGCYSTYTQNASIVNTDTSENSFSNLTGWVDNPTTTSGASVLTNVSLTRSQNNSDISASSREPPSNEPNSKAKSTTYGWEYFADKLKDGASYIGYDEGEIFKRAQGKESFFTVFTESPFYQNKLNKKQQGTSEEAINYPEDNIEKVKEKYAATKEKKTDADKDIVAEDSKNSETLTTVTENAKAYSGPVVYRISQPTSEKKNLPYYNKEVIASLAGDRAPASLHGSPVNRDDLSIFERVSLTYKKVSPALKRLEESQTAKDIQKLETPSFFKNL